MSYLNALRRVAGRCLSPMVGALAMITVVACGIFPVDEAPVPTSTAIPARPPPAVTAQVAPSVRTPTAIPARPTAAATSPVAPSGSVATPGG